MNNWYKTKQLKSNLFLIQERLDLIEPRFHTIYTNLYLIRGEHTSVLFDTGSGVTPLHPIINELNKDNELIVINSHNHFDHIGGNSEFDVVYIHRMDLKKLMSPIDISFLKQSSLAAAQSFHSCNYQLISADEHIPLIGGERFDLGNLEVEVIHTSGHTSGSVSLYTSENDLFTGDTIHYGVNYLPEHSQVDNLHNSLVKLLENYCDNNTSIFPGHEEYNVSASLIIKFLQILENLDQYHQNRVLDTFLDAWIINLDEFGLVYPKE